MVIVLASDNNYVQHCAATMASIIVNNIDEDVCFYILTEGINDSNKRSLLTLEQKYEKKIHICTVPSDIVQNLPMPSYMSSHISIATYYRLFVASILPESLDKIIYLDSDIIVRGSLVELWNTNMDNYPLAAVYQANEWADNNDTWTRLNLSRDIGYFNAGVLMINLKYWRENHVQEQLLNFIELNYDKIHSHDQDTLNAVLGSKTLALNCKWNLLPFLFIGDISRYSFPQKANVDSIKEAMKNPTVVHFVFKPKPWESGCNNPFRKEYYKYLSLTPWKGIHHKHDLKKIVMYRIRPSIISALSSMKSKMKN